MRLLFLLAASCLAIASTEAFMDDFWWAPPSDYSYDFLNLQCFNEVVTTRRDGWSFNVFLVGS